MNIKQLALGSSIGRLLIFGRSKFQLISAAAASSESIGTLMNDQLAAYLLPRLCAPGKTFIDVGSHIGSVIAEVQHHDGSISIIAIEAIPEKAERLHRKFPRVAIYNYAVGDQSGKVSFFINTRKSGYSSLGKATSAEGLREITVSMRRLDDLIFADNVDVIKIDVEGAELGVLRGAKKLIQDNRPVIMFESGPDINELGYTKEQIWEFLTYAGYTIHIPNRVAHNDDGLSMEGFIDSHVYPRRCTNYFAIPTERRIDIRDRAREILGINRAAYKMIGDPDRSINIDY
jgi:FkbM family methyltransferase